MATFKDIITGSDFDLVIENGDLKFDESDSQHVEHIITADKGHFRQYPLIGVGIRRMSNGDFNIQEVKQSIKLQLESDGYNVRNISVKNNALDIDAERKTI